MRGSVEISSEQPYQEQLQAEIESLRQQLAAALAACKVKDEALEYISQNYDEGDYDWQVALNALATTEPKP